MLVNVTQYLTYTRYRFYGSKFHILYVVSFKFRKQFKKCSGKDRLSNDELKKKITSTNLKTNEKTSTNLTVIINLVFILLYLSVLFYGPIYAPVRQFVLIRQTLAAISLLS
jgi:hypothetical protein